MKEEATEKMQIHSSSISWNEDVAQLADAATVSLLVIKLSICAYYKHVDVHPLKKKKTTHSLNYPID